MARKKSKPRPKLPLGTSSQTFTAMLLWREWMNGVEDGILAFKTEVW